MKCDICKRNIAQCKKVPIQVQIGNSLTTKYIHKYKKDCRKEEGR